MNGMMRAVLAFVLTAGVLASPGTTAPKASADIYGASMYFPVVGDNHYSDTFGASRGGGRSHHGVDIMAAKMTPVIAVADGTIGWMHDDQGGNCCAMSLRHDDGYESWYIHLNNDTPGTDDGQGWGFAEGIEPGAHVFAGQLIGWVGDSGNAEGVSPHLHFELHEPGGAVINPTPHVDAAIVLEAPLLEAYTGFFRDDEANVHQVNIDKIAAAGITIGCNPPVNDKYCPSNNVTRGQIAAFVRRDLGLPDTLVDYFADDDESVFNGDINALAEAGIAFGCTETDYCPNTPLRRDELAEVFVRAYGFENPEDTNFFIDDEGNAFESSINAMAANGITVGCNAPDFDRYCPDDNLTRAQMASFIARALGL